MFSAKKQAPAEKSLCRGLLALLPGTKPRIDKPEVDDAVPFIMLSGFSCENSFFGEQP